MIFDIYTSYAIEYMVGFSCNAGEPYLPPTPTNCLIFGFKTLREAQTWSSKGVMPYMRTLDDKTVSYTFYAGFRRRVNPEDIKQTCSILEYIKDRQ